MSRRHKENDIKSHYEPLEAESHADGRLNSSISDCVDKLLSKLFTVTKPLETFDVNSFRQIIDDAIKQRNIEIDDQYVKIKRSFLEAEEADETLEENTRRGRPSVKRLLKRFSDSQVVKIFKKTKKAVIKKARRLYEDIAQLSVCFLNAIFHVFGSGEDPYGTLSHFHRILSPEEPELPTRKTLSNKYRWYAEWHQAAIETAKEKAERLRHCLWERLIDWISRYLQELAPQYAFA